MELFSWLAGSAVVLPGPGRHFTLTNMVAWPPFSWSRSLKPKFSLRAEVTMMTTDQQLALKAMSEAQHILEEYLEPRPHNNEHLLDRLVEVLERPDVLVAVDRLRRGGW
jgi:hypothetical protein